MRCDFQPQHDGRALFHERPIRFFRKCSYWKTVGFYAIASGAALGGLIIWMARRARGIDFPRYPGEVLLVLLGASVIYSLAVDFVIYVYEPLEYLDLSFPWVDLPLRAWVYYLLFAFVYLWAARRIDSRRWRTYFYTESAANGVMAIAPCLGIAPWTDWMYLLRLLGPAGVVLVVVIMDWRGRINYPWTHWLGPALVLWYAILGFAQFFWYRFFQFVTS